jgi:AcrR family transcriptional regulator
MVPTQEALVAKRITKTRKRAATAAKRPSENVRTSARDRVLAAAFATFTKHGYEGASTLKIASRANVSKRELYALFENKQGMLTACIAERARRMRLPLELSTVRDRETLSAALGTFGATVLREVSDPKVLAVHRLAIAEAERSPGVAEALNTHARRPNHAALTELLAQAQTLGLVGAGAPTAMASQFLALLWGDLLMQLLLRIANRPGAEDIAQRARDATEKLLSLYPVP